MHRRLLARTAPLGLVLALALTGCGTDDSTDPNTPSGEATERTSTPEPTETPSESETTEPEVEDAGTVITITREGDKFTPDGERVKVPLGEEITFAVDADEAGELHVHSTPEQQVSYKKGLSAHKLLFKQPGVVEVESHDPARVVLQLQVS